MPAPDDQAGTQAPTMLEWDERSGWAAMGERGWTVKPEGHGHAGVLSVWQGC